MARDLSILSEPRADISWFYDRGKPGLHKYFIHCFFFFSGWQKRAEEAESKGELGKDRSTYFDRIVKEGEKAGE